MNNIDIIILIAIAVGFVLGLFRGLIKELIAIAAIFIGIYGAKFLSPWLSEILVNSFSFTTKSAQPIAYITIFVGIVLILLFIAHLLEKLFDAVSLGGVNRFLGGLFGGIKYLLVASVLLNVFDALQQKFEFISPETVQNSRFYQPVLKVAPELWQEIREHYDQEVEKPVNAGLRVI